MNLQSKQDFYEQLKQNPRPLVVDFWAPWCVPCRAIAPVMKNLEKEYASRVDVWKINADEQPEILQDLKIYGIPTLVAFHNGQEIARRTGVATQATISMLFESALSGEKPVQIGLTALDRLLRFGVGLLMLFLAFQAHFSGYYLLLAGSGL